MKKMNKKMSNEDLKKKLEELFLEYAELRSIKDAKDYRLDMMDGEIDFVSRLGIQYSMPFEFIFNHNVYCEKLKKEKEEKLKIEQERLEKEKEYRKQVDKRNRSTLKTLMRKYPDELEKLLKKQDIDYKNLDENKEDNSLYAEWK